MDDHAVDVLMRRARDACVVAREARAVMSSRRRAVRLELADAVEARIVREHEAAQTRVAAR
jgi:hypothetical protein